MTRIHAILIALILMACSPDAGTQGYQGSCRDKSEPATPKEKAVLHPDCSPEDEETRQLLNTTYDTLRKPMGIHHRGTLCTPT